MSSSISKLKIIREARNLTQEELSGKSTISVRTIQRIEAGTEPRGQTLKLLSKALDVNEFELLERKEGPDDINLTSLKVINLSCLLFTWIPPANIVLPLIIMFLNKQFNVLTKQVLSLQIIWTVVAGILFLAASLLKGWFSLGNRFIPVVMLVLILSNVCIILRNALEIDKKGRLFFRLKFSML